jgi:hypothetical protein
VLRRWHEITPGCEYRAFVKGGRMAAVTQRDGTHHYGHIAQERESILTDLTSFFDEFIGGEKFELGDFVLDVVRLGKDRVKLVDFNPFGEGTTDPVLFTWDELEEITNDQEIQFR